MHFPAKDNNAFITLRKWNNFREYNTGVALICTDHKFNLRFRIAELKMEFDELNGLFTQLMK